ncbi:hypothetical protein [Larkinella ripae]
MTTQPLSSAGLLVWTFQFWRTYFGPISLWMLFAALGRAVQMKIFGPIPSSLFVSLEILVEAARIITILVIVGHGNWRQGVQNLGVLFRFKKQQWRETGRTARTMLRLHWPVLLGNLLLFSLLAYGFNAINRLIAEHRAVFYGLKDFGFMHQAATSMPLFFFLKNLTVIPFTVIFEYGLFMALAGKLPRFSGNEHVAVFKK